MRVFIGIQLPNNLQKKVISWQKIYQQTFNPSGIRFIQGKNLHVTIIPPWYIDNAEETIRLLGNKKLGLSFTLLFERIIFMPSERSKFTWLYGPVPEHLVALRQHISEVLQRPLEKRKYALHTTVARMEKDASVIPIEENIHWLVPIKRFSLFQSHISSQGAEYEVIREFSLE